MFGFPHFVICHVTSRLRVHSDITLSGLIGLNFAILYQIRCFNKRLFPDLSGFDRTKAVGVLGSVQVDWATEVLALERLSAFGRIISGCFGSGGACAGRGARRDRVGAKAPTGCESEWPDIKMARPRGGITAGPRVK